MDIDKDKIIKDVYYTPSGYASMRQTLLDARKKDTVSYTHLTLPTKA